MTDAGQELTDASREFAHGRLPQIEVITRPEPEQAPARPKRSLSSLLVWPLAAFALVVVPASLWNFTRPPVYRAAATVLTAVPESRSGNFSDDDAPDPQHVAIQRQLMLGRELLASTLERVKGTDAAPQLADPPLLTPDDLRPLLSVDAVPSTNLVEMSATGGKPALLAALVNEWLAAYETLRQREVQSQVGDRLVNLQTEAKSLDDKIRQKRAALEQFRADHDIVTLERDSNQALNRLNTIQQSLAKAEEESITARAAFKAMQAAVANGQAVAPKDQAASLAQLEQKAAELRVQVAQLKERYTEMFIDNDPNKRTLKEQLAVLEARMEELKRQGIRDALKEASQAVDASTDQVLTLQRELSAQKVTASRFSTSFVEYQDLTSDLESLEKLQRETEEQRLALEAKAAAGYPQIEVIEPAYAPRDPIRPHYLRDLGLTLLAGAAVGLSTLLTLLWLDAKANARRAPAPVTGVRIWGQEPPRGEPQTPLPRAGNAPTPIEPPVGKLSDASLRQLMGGEVEALWELADDAERQVIGLLLSGLRPNEIAGLAPDDFDLDACSVRVKNDAGERVIVLANALCQLFAEADPLPAWAGSGSEHVQEILQRIPLLAMDTGVAHAQEVDAEALRHTYLVYLVRQGARLTELHRIAGPMGAAEIQRYAPYSPSGASRPLEQLTLAYPVLA